MSQVSRIVKFQKCQKLSTDIPWSVNKIVMHCGYAGFPRQVEDTSWWPVWMGGRIIAMLNGRDLKVMILRLKVMILRLKVMILRLKVMILTDNGLS